MAFLQISRFLRRSLFGGLLEVGVPGVRFAGGVLPCEGEVEIRQVPKPASEYATLSPEHEDYLQAQTVYR